MALLEGLKRRANNALVSLKRRIVESSLRSLNTYYSEVEDKLKVRFPISHVGQDGIHSDVYMTFSGSVSVNPCLEFYHVGELSVRAKSAFSGSIDDITGQYSDSVEDLNRQCNNAVGELESRKGTIEEIVQAALESRTPAQFSGSIAGLNSSGIATYARADLEQLGGSVQQLGKLLVKMGSKRKGLAARLQGKAYQLSAHVLGADYEGPLSEDQTYFRHHNNRYNFNIYEYRCRFQYNSAGSRVQYGENMVERIVNDYVNSDKTVDQIVKDAKSDYNMSISKSTLYKVIDRELGKGTRRRNKDRLKDAYASKVRK